MSVQRFFEGKITTTPQLGVNLLLTALSLSPSSFVQTTKNVRIICNVSRDTRYYLLPEIVNKITKKLNVPHINHTFPKYVDSINVHGNLLFDAVYRKDMRYLNELLDAGIDVNKRIYTYEFHTSKPRDSIQKEGIALQHALVYKFFDGAERLFERGSVRGGDCRYFDTSAGYTTTRLFDSTYEQILNEMQYNLISVNMSKVFMTYLHASYDMDIEELMKECEDTLCDEKRASIITTHNNLLRMKNILYG
jgi:hypothetical protein